MEKNNNLDKTKGEKYFNIGGVKFDKNVSLIDAIETLKVNLPQGKHKKVIKDIEFVSVSLVRNPPKGCEIKEINIQSLIDSCDTKIKTPRFH